MQTPMTAPAYDCFTIHVPHIEAKRFKAIVKAFGFDFHVRTQSPLERSIEEEKAGNVYTYAPLNELMKEFE